MWAPSDSSPDHLPQLGDKVLFKVESQYSLLSRWIMEIEDETPDGPYPLDVYNLAFSLMAFIKESSWKKLSELPSPDAEDYMSRGRTNLIYYYLHLLKGQHNKVVGLLARIGPPDSMTEYEMDLLDKVTFNSNGDTHTEVDAPCSICISDFVDGEMLYSLPCSHKFHEQCVGQWLKSNRTCPLCRGNVSKVWE